MPYHIHLVYMPYYIHLVLYALLTIILIHAFITACIYVSQVKLTTKKQCETLLSTSLVYSTYIYLSSINHNLFFEYLYD